MFKRFDPPIDFDSSKTPTVTPSMPLDRLGKWPVGTWFQQRRALVLLNLGECDLLKFNRKEGD